MSLTIGGDLRSTAALWKCVFSLPIRPLESQLKIFPQTVNSSGEAKSEHQIRQETIKLTTQIFHIFCSSHFLFSLKADFSLVKSWKNIWCFLFSLLLSTKLPHIQWKQKVNALSNNNSYRKYLTITIKTTISPWECNVMIQNLPIRTMKSIFSHQ